MDKTEMEAEMEKLGYTGTCRPSGKMLFSFYGNRHLDHPLGLFVEIVAVF